MVTTIKFVPDLHIHAKVSSVYMHEFIRSPPIISSSVPCVWKVSSTHSRSLTECLCPLVLSFQQVLGWLTFLLGTSCKYEDSCLKKTSPNSSCPGVIGTPNIFCIGLMADHNSHTLRYHLSAPRLCSKHSHCSCPSATPLSCHFRLSFLNSLCPLTATLQGWKLSLQWDCSSELHEPSNFFYFNPLLCALMYRHFRETPRHTNSPERMWGVFPIMLSCCHFPICVHPAEVQHMQSCLVNYVVPCPNHPAHYPCQASPPLSVFDWGSSFSLVSFSYHLPQVHLPPSFMDIRE